MPKLNDTQSILLSSAAQRDHGSLFPWPKTIAAGSRVNTALASLIKAGFAEERQVSDVACMYRQDGDLSVGVFVTAAGLAAIGVTEGRGDEAPVPAAAPEPATTKPSSKRDAVIALLARDCGATVAELIAATGWLPHTTRAALTGLRKAGHDIVRGKREDVTCYSMAPAVAA